MSKDAWTEARHSNHALAALDGIPIAGATTGVSLGPRNRIGAVYFRMILIGTTGQASQPLLLGLQHSGPYPSYNWIEIIMLERTAIFADGQVTLPERALDTLFGGLSGIIPPGGHMMVEYESAQWADTRLSAECGIPWVATPLGSMLFRVGCGVAFKDWHFAEGGSEGPRKLQGYKALNEVHRHTRAADMAAELQSFLQSEKRAACADLWDKARNVAVDTLSVLASDIPVA